MTKKMTMFAVIALLAAAGTLQAKGMGRQGAGPGVSGAWHGKGGFGQKFGKRMVTHMRDRLSEKLDLSAEQEKKVEEILTAKAEKAKALLEEARKKGDALRQEGSVEIRAILDKEQAKTFDKLKSRMERRRDERRARRLGDGGNAEGRGEQGGD
ncbi:MAG: hypothetical protein CO113_01210 [Elusimicrobia bacterium CG_4_9_14_3_um_filter_62_55]|nr:MAG: hypothetical protein COR54_14695 [Elusimicrobia bacterium CG22_combo_CG10-13_8_21_14_all_63_91]PJA16353.1 MAG: hypothetical protein COX66_07755 [Elusimicrobia bacterium CG_4_10_14_0_2_um_filter_63_34]PJB26890.1 MAG: hypothetical protein CO113_01210 [Elusimicrobia bacterium CG_4_9_14_3_um_filter_62_55]